MQILQGVPKLLHATVLMETQRKHAVKDNKKTLSEADKLNSKTENVVL